MNEESFPPAPDGLCPICNATNAFVQPIGERDVVFVECVNCRVYRATRRAYRHFEYLRWRQDPAGLAKLARLAAALKGHTPSSPIRLEYDSWEYLADELGSGSG